MMFYSRELRVVLATVHVALADVPRLLSPASAWSDVIRLAAPQNCRGSGSSSPGWRWPA